VTADRLRVLELVEKAVREQIRLVPVLARGRPLGARADVTDLERPSCESARWKPKLNDCVYGV
jgi:hypothetical protein